MAAPTTENSVNGNYAAQPNYQSAESYQPAQSTNAQAPSQSTEPESATSAQTPSSAEIGWYFVEQYYTTMSKEPGKLFLFYTKKSQFVAGNEAEQVSVAVGPKKISEMISKLDIQDCKVRVSNVDTQQSGKNILVQVIGEISNRATPLRKFVQTFVLAEQPTGYYVLNDIFRYIADDEEEEDEPSAERVAVPAETAEPKTENKTLASSQDPAEKQRDVELVDQKLQKTASDESAQVPTVVKSSPEKQASAETTNQENSAVAQDTSETVEDSVIEDATKSVAQEEITQPEKPRDPEPTPSASPPKPAKAVPAEVPSGPPKPSVPKTWANLVASKGTSGPAATAPQKSTTAAAPASSAPKAVNTAVKENSSPSAPVNEDSTARPQSNGGAAWQNVGSDKQRQNRQQSVSNASENVLAYVKNVTEKVDPNALRTALANFGKIVYFDVSRPKNCAFVEFADSAGYNACVSANPHTVSGEQVFVEERRPRNAGYGGNFGPRGGMRGGRGGLNDRPGNQGRGGFNKDGGRGGFAPRGRGGALTPRGRGQPQPA